MAAGILMIVFYHSQVAGGYFILRALKGSGYGGVDIFIFASGIGCYASYTKDRDMGRFLKKRAFRILPTYWMILIVWMLVKTLLCGEKLYVSQIVGNIFCVQTLTGNGNDLARYSNDLFERYPVWYAEYGALPAYTQEYVLWQYASEGQVNGIGTTVDLNLDLSTVLEAA